MADEPSTHPVFGGSPLNADEERLTNLLWRQARYYAESGHSAVEVGEKLRTNLAFAALVTEQDPNDFIVVWDGAEEWIEVHVARTGVNIPVLLRPIVVEFEEPDWDQLLGEEP